MTDFPQQKYDFSSESFGTPFPTVEPQADQPMNLEQEPDDEDRRGPVIGCIVVLLVLLAIAAVVFFVFIKEGSDDQGGGVENGATVDNGEFPYSKLIDEKGGRVEYVDGAYVEIPKGAVSDSVRISIEKVAAGKFTDLYHFLPDGFTFEKPVTVGIPYHDGDYTDEDLAEITLVSGPTRSTLTKKNVTEVDKTNRLLITTLAEF